MLLRVCHNEACVSLCNLTLCLMIVKVKSISSESCFCSVVKLVCHKALVCVWVRVCMHVCVCVSMIWMQLSVFVCAWDVAAGEGKTCQMWKCIVTERESPRRLRTDAPFIGLFFICSHHLLHHLLTAPFYSILSCHVSLSCRLSLSTCSILSFHILSVPVSHCNLFLSLPKSVPLLLSSISLFFFPSSLNIC